MYQETSYLMGLVVMALKEKSVKYFTFKYLLSNPDYFSLNIYGFYARYAYCSIFGILTSTVGDVNTSVNTCTIRGPLFVDTGLIGALVTGPITSRTFVHVLCTVTSSPTCVTVTFSCDSITTLTVGSIAYAFFRTLFSVVKFGTHCTKHITMLHEQ